MNQNPAAIQRPFRPDLAPTLIAALNDETDPDAPTVRTARAMLEDACHIGATDVHRVVKARASDSGSTGA